jgi:hypothetical protein
VGNSQVDGAVVAVVPRLCIHDSRVSHHQPTGIAFALVASNLNLLSDAVLAGVHRFVSQFAIRQVTSA